MHMEIETLAASPTCRAHIFTVGRSLRLAYPEAEVAGGIRSSDKGRARLTPPWGNGSSQRRGDRDSGELIDTYRDHEYVMNIILTSFGLWGKT
jgi:hypothetical protein